MSHLQPRPPSSAMQCICIFRTHIIKQLREGKPYRQNHAAAKDWLASQPRHTFKHLPGAFPYHSSEDIVAFLLCERFMLYKQLDGTALELSEMVGFQKLLVYYDWHNHDAKTGRHREDFRKILKENFVDKGVEVGASCQTVTAKDKGLKNASYYFVVCIPTTSADTFVLWLKERRVDFIQYVQVANLDIPDVVPETIKPNPQPSLTRSIASPADIYEDADTQQHSVLTSLPTSGALNPPPALPWVPPAALAISYSGSPLAILGEIEEINCRLAYGEAKDKALDHIESAQAILEQNTLTEQGILEAHNQLRAALTILEGTASGPTIPPLISPVNNVSMIPDVKSCLVQVREMLLLDNAVLALEDLIAALVLFQAPGNDGSEAKNGTSPMVAGDHPYDGRSHDGSMKKGLGSGEGRRSPIESGSADDNMHVDAEETDDDLDTVQFHEKPLFMSADCKGGDALLGERERDMFQDDFWVDRRPRGVETMSRAGTTVLEITTLSLQQLEDSTGQLDGEIIEVFGILFATERPSLFFGGNTALGLIQIFSSSLCNVGANDEEFIRALELSMRGNAIHACWKKMIWMFPRFMPELGHWLLVVALLPYKFIIVYDSAPYIARAKQQAQGVVEIINRIVAVTEHEKAWEGWAGWTAQPYEVLPQSHPSESGLWTLAHMLALCRGSCSTGQTDMEVWRRRLLEEALMLPVIGAQTTPFVLGSPAGADGSYY